ncbi:protein of unknown function [Rhodovastum atsumiense]|nr:protein of unknown function [Rhodovastum atsumiense]
MHMLGDNRTKIITLMKNDYFVRLKFYRKHQIEIPPTRCHIYQI